MNHVERPDEDDELEELLELFEEDSVIKSRRDIETTINRYMDYFWYGLTVAVISILDQFTGTYLSSTLAVILGGLGAGVATFYIALIKRMKDEEFTSYNFPD